MDREIKNKMFANSGIHFISGANTIEGTFYGISVGAIKPDSIKVEPIQEMYINGSAVTSDTELSDFLNEGEFVPIVCSSITITGSGYLKAYITQ